MQSLTLPLLVVLAACGGGSTVDAGSVPLACAATLDAYCAAHECVLRAIDRSTCGVSFFICPAYEVFLGEEPGEFDYYDPPGNLYAIIVAGNCVAGPTTFTPPSFQLCAQPGPTPCDGGV